jgi:hypothetical protein
VKNENDPLDYAQRLQKKLEANEGQAVEGTMNPGTYGKRERVI